MAIKIDIPGVGEVTVEGAAQESTMQDILKAVSKSEKSKRADEAALKKAREEELTATKAQTSALDKLIKEEEQAAKETRARTDEFKKGMKTATVDTIKNLGSFASSLASTATAVAVSMIKNIDQNAADPIQFGAQIINTGIDLLATALKIGVDAVSAFAQAGLSLGGPFLQGAQNATEKLAQLSKEVIDFGSAIAKAGNEFMAAEFQKTVKSMKALTAAGAGFAGGMTELRDVANRSGVGISVFTEIISKSRDSIVGMGMSATEATRFLSKGMAALNTTVGRSGKGLRDELLALGYSYEEQGELLAQYSAQQRTAGKLRTMTDTEIAQGTAQYAKDLKVLADITGKNARKAQEDAMSAALEADIIAKLTPEEAEKFQAAYRAMPDNLKKGFMEYVASGGEIIADQTTNIMMAQNSKITDIFTTAYGGIKDASKKASEVQDATLRSSIEAGKAQKGLNTELAFASRITGAFGDVVKGQNELIKTGMLDPDAVEKSRLAQEGQAVTTDAVTQGFTSATHALTDFQIQTETLATKLLPDYAIAIKGAIETVTNAVSDAMAIASGRKTLAQVAKERGISSSKTALSPSAMNMSDVDLKNQMSVTGVDVRTGQPLTKEQYQELKKSGAIPKLSEGKAKGGISTGSLNGYSEILHGTEAVVPLPDGKTIPVSLDSGTITAAVHQQTAVLNEILSSMQRNNNLTSGILQNSY